MSVWKRLVPVTFVLYILVMVGVTISGIGSLGFYDDEFIHVNKLQTFLDFGVYLVNDGPAGATELVNPRGHVYVYGPLFSLIAHAVAVLAGVETWGTVSTSTDAFAIRHYTVAAFSLLGAFAAGWGVSLVTRSKTWGLAAAAILVSIPMWTGSAMYNIKDIAPASGFTLLTAGCIALTLPSERLTRATRIGGWTALFVGSLILWGIRPGLWPALVIAFVAMALIFARLANFSGWGAIIRRLVVPSTAVIASYLVMVVVYPQAFANPVVLLYKSFADTSSFAIRRGSLTDGAMPTIPPSWSFLPQWAAAQLPEAIGVLALVGSGVAIWLVVRRLFQNSPQPLDSVVPALVFVFFQFAAFPIAAVVFRSPITSGLRQFLFVLPALAMLVVLLLFIAKNHWLKPAYTWVWGATVGAIVVSIGLTTVAQFQLFPYNANFFNPSTVARGIEGRWEVDRYRLSDAELYGQLSASEREHCLNCAPLQYPDKFVDAVQPETTPVRYWQSVSLGLSPKSDKNCEVVATVERTYLVETVGISYANKCTIAGAPLTALPVEPTERRDWWRKISQWGWSEATDISATTRAGEPAAIAWRGEPVTSWHSTTVTLSAIVTEGNADAVIVTTTVNGGEPLAHRLAPGTPTAITLTLPAGAFLDSPGSLIVIEFRVTDASGNAVTNQLSLTDVRVASS